MEVIPHIWLVKFVLTWIITSIKCDAEATTQNVGNIQTSHYAEFIRYDTDPVTHMEMTSEKRQRRTPSAFDRGYDEFLRNYNNDNDVDRKGRYRVKESEPSESNESDESNESESDERSAESEEHTRKHFNKAKPNHTKSNRNQKDSPKKKTKHCKSEKRGNMLCNICYNPKNDEKSESCSFNSEPKEKNYAYSNDKRVDSKNKERESFEDDNESENSGSDEASDENDETSDENSEEVEEKRKPPPSAPKHPVQPVRRPPPTGPYGPRYFPPFQQRFVPQHRGPQVFPPPYRGAPIRIQVNDLPANIALIRYRTIGTPNGNQHIRIVTYPNGQSQTQFMNRPPPDLRPPRDVNGAQSQRLLSNISKEIEFLGGRPLDTTNHDLMAFMNKDWTNCKRSFEDGQICFECHTNGSRRKQCMYASQLKKRPENFYRSYSKTKNFEHNHPYAFELPTKSTPHRSKHRKPPAKHNDDSNDDSNSETVDSIEPAPVYENNDWDSNDFNYNGKRRPQAQPLRSAADIIYGAIKPGSEPLALFFNKDFARLNNTIAATTTTTTEKSI